MGTTEMVTIKYQTSKEYCSCCGREFNEKLLGETKEFDIHAKNIFEWVGWNLSEIDKDFAIAYEEDAPKVAEEYIYNTISFYASSSNEILHINQDDFKKVVDMVVGKIKNRQPTVRK